MFSGFQENVPHLVGYIFLDVVVGMASLHAYAVVEEEAMHQSTSHNAKNMEVVAALSATVKMMNA